MKVLAVAWDIDGTLIDSEPLHHTAMLAASQQWGTDLSDISVQTLRGVHMHEVWDLMRRRLPETLTKEVWLSAIEDQYLRRCSCLLALPGVAAVVEAIAALNIAQICVSNSSRRIVDANLDMLGLSTHIAFSISLNDVDRGKPDPQPYQLAAAKLAIDPRAMLAIEDSDAGARSARAAGMFVVGHTPAGGHLAAAHLCVANISSVIGLLGRCSEDTIVECCS